MNESILVDYDNLPREEKTAWDAWFNGGLQNISQYQNKPEDVFMGKAECQWVPFQSFWLDKVVKELKWMTAEVTGEFIAKGMVGQQKVIKYKLWPTGLGWAVRETELERWKQRVAANSK